VEKRRTERYIKRLECEFSGAGKTHKGFVSDISEAGLFIRTRRSFKEGSDVDIKLYLPDDSISSVGGVVRRALTSQEGTLAKNGMGIELLQRDDNYVRLLKELRGEEEKKRLKRKKPERREPEKKPEKVIVQCAICGVKNAVPRDKLSKGPKCGGCKAPLELGEEFHEAKADAEKAEPVLIACPECGAKNKVPADKLSLGPKCGACKAPLVPKEEEPAPEEPTTEEPTTEEPAPAEEEQSPAEEKKEVEFVMIKCPGCGAKNKLPANKLSLGPKCGNCKEPLPTE
jgi:RNase P subunit RPR2